MEETTKIETVAAVNAVDELAERVSKIEAGLAKTTKIAKRGAIGVSVAFVAAGIAIVWRKKAKKAEKKAKKAEAKAAEAEVTEA